MESDENEWTWPGADDIKRYKDTLKAKGPVLPAVMRHAMRQVGEADERDPFVLHPSDLAKSDWCPRHDFYRLSGRRQEKQKSGPSFVLEQVFAYGDKVHEKYQLWLKDMGVLWGTWRCESCYHRWEEKSPESCPTCGHGALRYLEVILDRSPYVIRGHSDGAVHDLDGWTGLIEIKSIGLRSLAFEVPSLYQRYIDGKETPESVWMKIKRPFPSHLVQGQLYMWLSWPKYSQIAFIYESKFNQRNKEFVVKYDPSLIETQIEGIKLVTDAVGSGEAPFRPEWAIDMQVSACRSCPYRKHCWSDRGNAIEETPKEEVRVIKANPRKRRVALRPPG